MKPLAFHPGVMTPQSSPPTSHGASAASSVETFAAVLHGLNTPEVQARLKGQKSDAGADPESIANSGAASEGKPASQSSPSIEAALAALGYPSSAPLTDAAGPARSVFPVAAPRTHSGSASGPAALAARVAPEAGGAELVAATPSQNSLFEDPTLGFQSVQSRAHLIVTDARTALAGLDRAGTVSGPAPQASPLIGAPPAAAETAVPSASQMRIAQSNGSSLANVLAAIVGAAGTSAAASSANSAPAAMRTKAPSSQPAFTSAHRLATSEPGSLTESHAVSQLSGERALTSEGGSEPTGNGGSAAPDGTLATSNAAPATGTAAFAPIGINQLADFVANHAASLVAESASAAIPKPPANSAPQAVKELEIALAPEELGAVSIKMRLANGKLTVVIGVANATTRQAIESDREAILDRLASNQQPLETLVIKSDGQMQTQSGGNDASDPNNPRQSPANDDPANAERGAGGGAQYSRGRSGHATLQGASATSGDRSSDLIV